MVNLLTQPIVFPLTGTIAKLLTGTMVNVLDFCNTGKSISISIWDSEEDALCNEESHVYQEQLVKFMSLFTDPPYREGYEVLVQG